MEIKPKKSLGQNFLVDKNIIKKIVEAGNILPNSVILEVGAGTGNLTESILEKRWSEKWGGCSTTITT